MASISSPEPYRPDGAYDGGLVAVSVQTYASALELTGDEQAAMELYCGGTFATPSEPMRSCTAPMFGATRIRIPPAGTENDDANPPRIAPHHLIDIGLGFDCLRLGAVPVRLFQLKDACHEFAESGIKVSGGVQDFRRVWSMLMPDVVDLAEAKRHKGRGLIRRQRQPVQHT